MLDFQTFMLIIGIGNLSFAGLMAAYARGAVAQPALQRWMWARVLLGLCQLASWGNLSWESTVLAQLISFGWMAGMAMELSAYCQFFRYTNWQRFLYPATALCMAGVAAVQLHGVSIGQVVSVIALAVGVFAGAMGAILLWPRGGTPVLQRIIGMNDVGLAVAVLLWVASGARADGAGALAGSAMQSAVLIAGYMLMIVKGFGFLLLCKQEDDRKMLHLATIDCLTGLLNRYAFFDRAEALRRHPAGAAQMSLLMLDLDHFKRINDRFGHATGDDALRLFARTVQAVLAGQGVVGRLGGEEFALALAAPLDEALALAERLRAAVSGTPLDTGNAPYDMSVSIGVVALAPGDMLTAGLARADQALYDAKAAGRNRVVSCGIVHATSPLVQAAPAMVAHDNVAFHTPQARQHLCI